MRRSTRATTVLIAAAIVVSVVGQRLVGAQFSPAAAHEPTLAVETHVSTDPIAAIPGPTVERVRGGAAAAAAEASAESLSAGAPASVPGTALELTASPDPSAPPASLQPTAPQPPAPPAPVATPKPTAPPVATVAPTTAPSGCPATWFCYPRLGIAGAIVPYSDCSGATDVGTSIRSFTCLSPFYLMGHAYTQFGLVTQWRAGDIVFASGRQFTITGAFTQSSCAPPAQAIAPLSLQTSLTSGGCGSVLVVQGK